MIGTMAEMVDAVALGAAAERHGSSILPRPNGLPFALHSRGIAEVQARNEAARAGRVEGAANKANAQPLDETPSRLEKRRHRAA